MKISELQTYLEELKSKTGDVEILISREDVDYYDGRSDYYEEPLSVEDFEIGYMYDEDGKQAENPYNYPSSYGRFTSDIDFKISRNPFIVQKSIKKAVLIK